MALVSPGLQLSVTDESQYVPGAVGSVPLVLLATAQDKTNPSGITAAGTTKANAGALQAYTSQRDLASAFGYATFQQSSAGTPLHGDERNEYGLMAAHSALGIGNRVYAIRADIDLAQLEGTANRPTGTVADGTYWLDLTDTDWGVFEWNATTSVFTKKTVTVISPSDTAHFSSATVYDANNQAVTINSPVNNFGDIGSYAAVLSPVRSPSGAYNSYVWYVFNKAFDNSWNVVGSREWQATVPTAIGAANFQNPTVDAATDASKIMINGVEVTVGSTTTTFDLADVVAAINAADITGVVAAASSDNRLAFYVTDAATSDGETVDGKLDISNSQNSPLAELGFGTGGTYNCPALQFDTYVGIPAWRWTDTGTTRPTGSIYIKTTATGNGANFVVKKYSGATGTWAAQSAPLYSDPVKAIYSLDPSGGGYNIAAGAIFLRHDVTSSGYASIKPYYRRVAGATRITGVANSSDTPFTSGQAFTISYTAIGSDTYESQTVTLSARTRAEFVSKILAKNITEITASTDNVAKTITLTHKFGGQIKLTNNETATPGVYGTVVQDAGFTTAVAGVIATPDALGVELSNWGPLSYTSSATEPTQDPVDGTLWYYSSATDVDVMINTSTGWMGYRNETNDSRGMDLSQTDANGVIVSASKPSTQSDGSTALVAGDLWLNTSDLENWPALYRYTTTEATNTWVKLDITDNIGQNGVLFADARWGTSGDIDPVSGTLPSIADLTTSDYIDQDAPDYRLYPRGIILFNTRRSGYNVKRFVSDYFTEDNFSSLPTVPGAGSDLPAVTGTWISASGLKDNGSMYAGHQAQRAMIVEALKAAIDSNTAVREDQYAFNLIACPGYPELIANMVALNNDRANTAFVIGDTPFRLKPSTVDIIQWSNNTDNTTGLTTNDPYLGVYYPGAALTNDVQGNSVVVPASHIALRTYLHSDNMSYEWFAPAGTRRGMVDNATSVGYIDPVTGEYNPIGVNQGLRDSLYENKINPITNLPGVGLVIWGQKTRNPVASAMDRVNVARLVNYIRTILANVGNGFLFEPNDKITRDQLKTIISGALNDLVSKRGVYDYLVVCDDSNNTPTRIARNELYVDVAIEPMKDVEFIYIPIRLYNPGDIAKLGA